MSVSNGFIISISEYVDQALAMQYIDRGHNA